MGRKRVGFDRISLQQQDSRKKPGPRPGFFRLAASRSPAPAAWMDSATLFSRRAAPLDRRSRHRPARRSPV